MFRLQVPLMFWLALVGLFLGVWLNGLPVLAGFKPPGNLDRPGNREGAASRLSSGPSLRPESTRLEPSCITNPADRLVALVPLANNGLTSATHPSFYWVMPANRAESVSFKLYPGNAKPNPQPIYQTTLKARPAGGLTGLTLPTQGVPPLALDQDYLWEVTYTCPTSEVKVVSWIRRVSLSPSVNDKITQAQGRSRYLLAAEAGLWYDALATLVTLRRAEPQDATLARDWADLLASPAIKLDQFAREPLFSPPTQPN